MDYKYIETLARKAKDGDVHSKEQLAEEFKPFIINLANKTFIHGYDFYDLQNECYHSLFKCLSLYNIKYSTAQKRKKRIFNKIQQYLMNKICYN